MMSEPVEGVGGLVPAPGPAHPLRWAGLSAVELPRRVVMDYAPDDCDSGGACSAAMARAYLREWAVEGDQ